MEARKKVIEGLKNQNLLEKIEDYSLSLPKCYRCDLEGFRFGQVAHKLYDFFWHDFCDIYIERLKKQKTKNQKLLLYLLLTSLKLLHSFIPFITEEIYQKLPLKNKKNA